MFKSTAKLWVLCVASALAMQAGAQQKSVIFKNGFDSDTDLKKWALIYGTKAVAEQARTGTGALLVEEGEASVRSRVNLNEQGTLEFWIKTSSPATQYTINVLVATNQNIDSGWMQVGQIKGSNDSTEYHAKRISIDDPGKKYLRLDFEVTNGQVWIDDLSVEKILLDTALQKNQEKVIAEVLGKLRDDKNYQVQADALRTLGKNYAAQIDVQRQYLEYANGIYSSVTLVLATSERGKMANPLGYHTFKGIVSDVRMVASPIQKSRMESLLKPLGDIATASLNVMTQGAYQAFAEPFKTIVATTFDRVSYENAGIDRKARKFAEANGLKTFAKAEGFLGEVEKELNMVVALDKDLMDIQREVDKFRKDLDKHLKESLIAGGMGRGQENYNRVLSKDETIRTAALQEINNYFLLQAESYQNHSSSNTEFVQFMMKATGTMEETQVFKERFNQIASSVITFYDKFDRSVAKEQNPFTSETDRALWESHAVKVRTYIQESKAAFAKAYM
ncbi:BAR domain-like protein A BdpA [Cellvibrio sp. UBA7661]|uniref:BAR domain-like protein A BdpA n=1 Tax=Cellvibrio sp. UBA7661 TaxID=1946311 RepID=UPI002F35CAFD